MAKKKKTFGNAPLGSGERFKECEASGKSAGLCAYIGRKAYGKSNFQRLAKKGNKK